MKFLVNLLVLLLSLSVTGQGPKDCSRYAVFLDSGRTILRTGGNYEDALNQFLSAQIAARECGKSTDEANMEIKKVFKNIEQQRDQAKKARVEADEERKRVI